MPMREIDGFNVESITVQHDPDVQFFHPALRVRKVGTDFDETTEGTPQNFERVSQRQAQQWADDWLARIEFVRFNGELIYQV